MGSASSYLLRQGGSNGGGEISLCRGRPGRSSLLGLPRACTTSWSLLGLRVAGCGSSDVTGRRISIGYGGSEVDVMFFGDVVVEAGTSGFSLGFRPWRWWRSVAALWIEEAPNAGPHHRFSRRDREAGGDGFWRLDLVVGDLTGDGRTHRR